MREGAISFMARHKVAGNLLMLIFLVGGLIFSFQIKKEVFPDYELDIITITATYSGAAPSEVEKGIVLPIEEAISGIDGIKSVTSVSSESLGEVSAELEIGVNKDRVLQDVKQAIDAIRTLPTDAERPMVSISSTKRVTLSVVMFGEADDWLLREQMERFRDRLLSHKGITQVEIRGAKNYEVRIEVNRDTLQKYSLTLAEISNIISRHALELSGGTLKTKGGEILLRLNERRDFAREFGDITIITSNNGDKIHLKDIAKIEDTFKEIDTSMTYNGKNALSINVFRVGEETPMSVSDAVLEVIEEYKSELPSTLQLEVVDNRAETFKARLDLLLKNAFMGLILVFLILGAFLEFRLAFWVAMGIPTAFIGTLLFLPAMDLSINMISMFAFIIALGIVVDDAIIVGENIYEYRQRGYSFIEASIKGAKDIAMPLGFAIITNIVAFMPLMFIPGFMGKTFYVIPLVVATAFLISWVEALYVLPNHLAHTPKTYSHPISRFLYINQQKIARGLDVFVQKIFRPSLEFTVTYRYVTVSLAIATLIVMIAYAQSGRLGFTLMPVVESDKAVASVKLPVGATFEEAKKIESILIKSGLKTVSETEGNISVGHRGSISENIITIEFFLLPSNERTISTQEFNTRWRKNTGEIAGVESIQYKSDIGGLGGGKAAISVRLAHSDSALLEDASGLLANELREIKSIKDVFEGLNKGKREFVLTLLPNAQILGLSSEDISRQVRNAHNGVESIRQLRGRNEVYVKLYLPKDERDDVADFNSFLIKTPSGAFVPLSSVARVENSRAPTSITRENGRRTLTVEANVDPLNDIAKVAQSIESDIFPKLTNGYQGLKAEFVGRQADAKEGMSSLFRNFILVLLIIYLLLALPFESYFQPIIVMVAIPFGVVGAYIGHIMLGYQLSLISYMGIVALAGVVINDTLVMMDYANRQKKEGKSGYEAIILAGTRRFRPIILTTATTFGGLAPMIFETSVQAKFLIPMAISLGFGILFATFITLVIMPALYMILEDVMGLKANTF